MLIQNIPINKPQINQTSKIVIKIILILIIQMINK
jgi:hypothetical protein